jgi:hypothetical protein
MYQTVRADSLKVGDVVRLPTRSGPLMIRLTQVRTRIGGIKFEGTPADPPSKTPYEWGWKADEAVVVFL